MKNRTFGYFSVFCIVLIFAIGSIQMQPKADEQSALSLTAEEESFIASHKYIKVGYVQDRIPVSFSNKKGRLSGMSKYIFDRICKLSGFKFEYIPLPAGDITYEYLLDQDLDLVTSVEYNKENQNANGILISEPYLSSRKVVVSKGDLEFSPDANLTVAISSGSQTIKKVFGKNYPNFKLLDYPSIPACFDALNSGEADLLIQNQFVVEYLISKPKYNDLKVIPVLGLDDQLCFSAVVAFSDFEGQSQEDGQMLINILNKAIAAMSEDERANCIIQGVMENQYKFTISDFLYRYRSRNSGSYNFYSCPSAHSSENTPRREQSRCKSKGKISRNNEPRDTHSPERSYRT